MSSVVPVAEGAVHGAAANRRFGLGLCIGRRCAALAQKTIAEAMILAHRKQTLRFGLLQWQLQRSKRNQFQFDVDLKREAKRWMFWRSRIWRSLLSLLG